MGGIGGGVSYLTSSELSVRPAQYQKQFIAVFIDRKTRDIGRKHFQVSAISLSYRIRGRVPRAQMKVKAKNIAFLVRKASLKIGVQRVPVKKTAVKRPIIIILMYSAIKIRAKLPALYSTLNPETISDSPSAKSNGVRFVSARVVINQVVARGRASTETQYELDVIAERFREFIRTIALRRIRDILTS